MGSAEFGNNTGSGELWNITSDEDLDELVMENAVLLSHIKPRIALSFATFHYLCRAQVPARRPRHVGRRA
jgi:hypothetical protein